MQNKKNVSYRVAVTSIKWEDKFGEIIEKEFCPDEPIEIIENLEEERTICTDNYSIDGQLVRREISKYDSFGKIMKQELYNDDGDLVSNFKYKYDDNCNLIQKCKYDEDGELVSRYKYSYDNNNLLTEVYNYDKDQKLKSKFEYKYDDKHNLTTKCKYNKTGKLKLRHKYKYNDQNLLQKENIYDGAGNLKSKSKFKYDDDTNLIEKCDVDKTGGSNYKTTITFNKYDSNGDIEQKRVYGDNIPLKLIEYNSRITYDEIIVFLESLQTLQSSVTEYIENEQVETIQDEKTSWIENIFGAITGIAIAWALFHFGSWNFIWAEKISFLEQFVFDLVEYKSIFLDSNGLIFRINDAYYGIESTDRFFDIPFLQWLMLVVSILLFVASIRLLFFPSTEE